MPAPLHCSSAVATLAFLNTINFTKMSKQIVRRSTYKALTQDALASFADNVFNNMSTLPQYQAFASDVDLLGQQLIQYKEALAKAVNGGFDRIAIKNEQRNKLLLMLDKISDLLNNSYTGEESWVISAGMETFRTATSTTAILEPPFDLRAMAKGDGNVVITFRLTEPKRVRNNAIEYSLDGGENWKNGSYNTATRITLKGFPSRQDMKIRVRSLGAGDKQSAWSKPVEVFVI
jgi:hypothetical protein